MHCDEQGRSPPSAHAGGLRGEGAPCFLLGGQVGRCGLNSRQGVESLAGLLFAHGGEVEVNEGGLERGVTEVGGELVKLGSPFKHMCGVAMTQGVGADFVMLFAEPGFGYGNFESTPDGGLGHVMTRVVEGLTEGAAGVFPPASHPGEEPIFITMRFPEGAQSMEKRAGDGDLARLGSFAVTNVDDEGVTINVLGRERERFAEAQAGMVNEGAVGAVTPIAKGGEEPSHFLTSENHREGRVALEFDLRPNLPFEAKVITVEGS